MDKVASISVTVFAGHIDTYNCQGVSWSCLLSFEEAQCQSPPHASHCTLRLSSTPLLHALTDKTELNAFTQCHD